jgi:hypothetical protein
MIRFHPIDTFRPASVRLVAKKFCFGGFKRCYFLLYTEQIAPSAGELGIDALHLTFARELTLSASVT